MAEHCVKFEQMLQLIGELGRWQAIVLAWSFVGGVLVVLHDISAVFIAEVPDHHCSLPDGGRPEVWLPIDNATGNIRQCSILTFPGSNVSEPCSDFTYTWGTDSSSVASEWNLVCSSRWLASSVQAASVFGTMFGSLFWGVVSDHFGRKRVVMLSAIALSLFGALAAFASSYGLFLTLKILTAMAQASAYNCLFVLCMEITSPQWRALMGLFYTMSNGAGVMLLSGVAYLERDWRRLQLYISLPAVLVLASWWVLPESPRWLIMQNRKQEALSVMKVAASRNGRQLLPDEQLLKMMTDIHASEVRDAGSDERSSQARCVDGAIDLARLLRTPKMRKISLACFCNWFIMAMVYYGISLGTADLSDSPHLAIFLTGLVEMPAMMLTLPLINKLGRRIGIIATYLMTAVTILSTLAVPAGLAWPALLLGTLAKLSGSASYSILHVYSTELYPTQLRGTGVSLAVVFGRIGAMLAPYIVDLLRPLHWTIPSCVFGASAVVATLAALLLPETVGRRMPETVEDIENGSWTLAEVVNDGSASPSPKHDG